MKVNHPRLQKGRFFIRAPWVGTGSHNAMRFRQAILSALIFVGLLAGLLLWLCPTPPPPVVLPNPNGYDDFVAAGRLVKTQTNSYLKMSEQELRDYVESSGPALRRMEEGLKKDCRVPIEYSTNFIPKHFPELAAMKSLALARVAEGKLAEIEGRTNEGAGRYLSAIHFAHEAFRGGLLIDHMMSQTCEAIGATPLQFISGSLDAKTSRNLVHKLEKLEADEEPLSAIEAREFAWSKSAVSPGGFLQPLKFLFQWRSRSMLAPALIKAEQRTMTIAKQRRELMLDLVVRAYELEKGKRPKSFSDLVPEYLKSIPIDPLTKSNLVYHF